MESSGTFLAWTVGAGAAVTSAPPNLVRRPRSPLETSRIEREG